MRRLRSLVLVLGWVGWVGAPQAQELPHGCAPEQLLKIVTTADQPGQDPKAFAGQPKTLWRLGEKYARLEEPLNPETRVHLLVVISEPDIWMVDRTTAKGRHLVDPGPRFVAQVPLFAELTTGIWPGLELGCEARFFRGHGATALHKEDSIVYLLKDGDLKVRLFTDLNDKPLRAEAERGEFKRGVDFLSYEILPELDPKLFERPEGVAYEEPQAAPAEPPSGSPAADHPRGDPRG